jgi:trehalose 6-phosphate phosphatase
MTSESAADLASRATVAVPHSFQPVSGANQILDWYISNPDKLLSSCCVFVDVDGTLIEYTDDPAAVRADPELRALLQYASDGLSGALALVSGRSVATLDTILAPLRLPVSGIYGLERRDANGVLHRRAASSVALEPVRDVLKDFAASCPGLIVEDKGTAIALHYRRVPAFGPDCRRIACAAAAELGPLFQIVEGSMVVEIKPAGSTKATAIEEFLREAPFADRTPIALGDDLSDRDAFAAVRRHGGIALAVGRRISGDYQLDNCRAARRCLASLVGMSQP